MLLLQFGSRSAGGSGLFPNLAVLIHLTSVVQQ